MSAQTIYDDLIRAGMTHEGACAMLGNMQCESGLKANIAQRGMTKLTDEQYTRLFDTNPERCISDGIGYGLCQWTDPQRKRNLRQFSRNWDVSVGAEDMQTAFAVDELKTEYAALWKYLCETDDLYTAAARICKEYERPEVNNVDERYEAAQKFQSELADGAAPTVDDQPQAETYWPPRMICEGMSGADVAVAQALLVAHGAELAVSSVFDVKTKNRAMEFQNSAGLHADGIIGDNTWAALLRR